jgi:outer membrane protein TolC
MALLICVFPFASTAVADVDPNATNVEKSLKDAWAASLKRSETIGENQELLIQANELQTQAKSALFPTVTGSATYFRQAVPASDQGISPAEQNTIKFSADQPLFRGFRDFAALRQRDDLTGAQKLTLDNAVRTLFYNLSTSYYNVLMYASDERNYLNEIEINRKYLSELQHFFKIGRSQETDLLTFQANIASLEAQVETTHGQLEGAKDILAYYTGWSRATGLEDNEVVPETGTIDSYLGRVDDRADVKTALVNVQAYEEGVPIARGQHLPSVDLLGDYYATRPGYLSGVNWDAELAITLPIFQGGAIQSQVRQAESVVRQYDLLLSDARRTAEEEIRTFYDAEIADQKQMIKLVDLVKWARKGFETEVKYFRNGLVTNLEVLQALTTWQDAQRQLDRQRFQVKLDSVKLQAATQQRAEVAVPPAVKHGS